MTAHARQLGFGLAHTVAAVQDLGATLATMTPRAYADTLDPDDVLELSSPAGPRDQPTQMNSAIGIDSRGVTPRGHSR